MHYAKPQTGEMKTVFVSATGKYKQGDLTPQLFRDLVQSYDPNIYEAGAFVAHTSEWNKAGIAEPPRLAAVKSLSDSFVDTKGRVYLSTDLDASDEYEDAQKYFPHKSIEYWEANDPRNPLNQDHVPADKKGRPYLRGFALLGDSPAAKLPEKITKFFGQLTADKRSELAQYCDAAHGLYAFKDDDNPTRINMKNIAKACGLSEDATEDQIVAKIKEMKSAAPSKTEKEYQDEIKGLKTKVETLEKGKGDDVKEYADKLTKSETENASLKTKVHELTVEGFVKTAQGKNPTIEAAKLERLKMFADRDFRDGDKEYTLAKSYVDEIPENKQGIIGKVPGNQSPANCPKKEEIKTYRDFLDLPGKKIIAFREAYPEYVEELREEFE